MKNFSDFCNMNLKYNFYRLFKRAITEGQLRKLLGLNAYFL